MEELFMCWSAVAYINKHLDQLTTADNNFFSWLAGVQEVPDLYNTQWMFQHSVT